MPLYRPLTDYEEYDEQRSWQLEARLEEQLHLARTHQIHGRVQTLEGRLRMVQQRLQYYAGLRGESLDFYGRQKQSRQQAWYTDQNRANIDPTHSSHFTSNTPYGPMPPTSQWQKVRDTQNQYRRATSGPQSRSLSDISLAPYQYQGSISPTYQGNSEAQKRAERFYARMRGVMDVVGGVSPLEAALRDPEMNVMLRRGEIDLEKLTQAAKIMETMRGERLEKALLQLAGESSSASSSSSSFSSSSLSFPQRAKFEEMLGKAQEEIEAWYKKTALNAGTTQGRLRQIYPNMSHEQLAAIQAMEQQNTNVIDAGAGTGKTETAFGAFLDMVFNQKRDPNSVVFSSMTKSGRDALYEKAQKVALLLPNWQVNSEDVRRRQFRTLHSLAYTQLNEGDTLQRMGFGGYKLLGAGSNAASYDTIGDAVNAREDTRTPYLERLLRENDITHHPSLSKLLSHISAIKQNQGNTQQYLKHYEEGKSKWKAGNRNDLDALFYFYEANLKRKEQGMAGTSKQTSPRYDLDDLIHMYAMAGAKKLTQAIQAGVFDEYQDMTPDQIRALRRNMAQGSQFFFAGDMGQRTTGSAARPDLMLPKAFPGMGQYALTGNYRGPMTSVASGNAIQMDPGVQATGASKLQVSMSGNMGGWTQHTYRPSFQQLHTQAFKDVLNTIGLSVDQLKQNVTQGAYPLAGAAIPPVQAPLIFQMDEERKKFLSTVEDYVAQSVGREKAARVMSQIFTSETPMGGSDLSSPLSHRQFHTIMVNQARSRGFMHPYGFVTRGGQWNEEDYKRMVGIMETRATEQTHFYGAGENFKHTPGFHNSPDMDLGAGVEVPHGFAPIISRTYENAVHGQGISYSGEGGLTEAQQYHVNMPSPSVSGGSDAAFSQLINTTLDLHKAVPVGSRGGAVGESAGLLPGGSFDVDYDQDEHKVFAGFQSAPMTAAALSGKFDMGPDMEKYRYGLQEATGFLQNGPSGEIPEQVTPYLQSIKPMIGQVKGRREETDYPAPSAIPGHDDIGKEWGKISKIEEASWDPLKKRWDYKRPTREADEEHVREEMRKFLRAPEVASHPRVTPLLEAQYSNSFLLGNVQMYAYKSGYQGIARQIKRERNNVPQETIDAIQKAAEDARQAKARYDAGMESGVKGEKLEKLVKTMNEREGILTKLQIGLKASQSNRDAATSGIIENLVKSPNKSSAKLGAFITHVASYLVSDGQLSPDLVGMLTDLAEGLGANEQLGQEQRGQFNAFANLLKTSAGMFIDHEQPMSLSEEELAQIKQQNPKEGALIERILRDKDGNLRDFAGAFASIKQFHYLQGAMVRSINSLQKAKELGIPLATSRVAPFQTEMTAYATRLEESGILDPEAIVGRAGKEGMQFFHTGESTGLEMYERRLKEYLQNPNITGEHRSTILEQLDAVSKLRQTLHNPENQEAWGHTLNILSRTVWGQGAFDPTNKEEGGQYTPAFESMFRYQKQEGVEGLRTLEQVQTFVSALQEATSHVQQHGTVKRFHVNALLEALGHDPDNQEFTGLANLASTFGSPESELSLADLAQRFPDERNDMFAQLTRYPLTPGREYELAGPLMKGQQEKWPGMSTGMRGTLRPYFGTPFGFSKNVATHRMRGLLTPNEMGRSQGMSPRDPMQPILMLAQEHEFQTNLFPVRADQLAPIGSSSISPQASRASLTMNRWGKDWPEALLSSPSSRNVVNSSLQAPSPQVEAPAGVFPRANQEKTEQGFFTSPSTRAPQPTWARSTRSQLMREIMGGRIGSGTLSYDEMHDAFVEGGAVRPEAQRQQIQAWRARQGKGFPPLRPRPQNRLPGPIPTDLSLTRGTSVVRHTPPRALLPMAPRAHATFLPRPQSSSSRPQLRAGRMLPAVSPLERQLFAQGQGGTHSRALRGGTTPPVLPFRILAGLSPQEKERFAKVLPAWQAHYAKVRGGGQQVQVQHQVHGAIGAPPPDPRVGFTNPPIPVIPGVESLHMSSGPPQENPSVQDQMRDLARDIRTGNKQFRLHPLSEEQRKAVESPARFRMITGGPGGGKTYTTAAATADWVASGKMLPSNIVSLSALHSGVDELHTNLDTYRNLFPQNNPDYKLPATSTLHGLAARILLNQDEKGNYPALEQQGVKNYKGRVLYEPDEKELAGLEPAEAESNRNYHSPSRFLRQALAGKGIHISVGEAEKHVKYIDQMKANRFGTGTNVYTAAIDMGQTDLNGGNPHSKQAMLVQMRDFMQEAGAIDYNDQLFHTARHLEQNGAMGLPQDLRDTQGVVWDEGQDASMTGVDMVSQFLGAISGNTPHMLVGMDPAQALLPEEFGAINVNHVPDIFEGMAQGFGQPLEKHVLYENRRSNLADIFFNNAVRNRTELAGEAKSPIQQPPESGAALGQYQKFSLARTHPQLFSQMFRSMIGKSGVSFDEIGKNVAAGQHPFAGINWEQPGRVLPKDIPAILNENKDQAIFAHEATQVLMKELGISEKQARGVYGQMTSSRMYKKPGWMAQLLRRGEKPSDEELAKQMQFPVVKHSGARSFDALYPHMDVTHSYGGDNPFKSLQQHFRKLFVAGSRVRTGGQNQFFATNRPLHPRQKGEYLRDPGLLDPGGAPDDLYNGVATFNNREIRANNPLYAFKQYGNMEVPPHFDELLGERDKALLESGAVSPTDSFFPPEVAPAIGQIAKELGIGTQPQQQQQQQQQPVGVVSSSPSPSSGIPRSQIIRTSTPPLSGSPASPSSATQAGLRELYGPLAGPLRRQLTDQQMTATRETIEGYHGTLQKTFAQLPAGVLPADFIAAEQERISQQSGSTPHGQLTKQGAMAVLGHLSNNPTQLLPSSSPASSSSSGASSPSTVNINATAGSKINISAQQGSQLSAGPGQGQQGPPGGTPPPPTAAQHVQNLLNNMYQGQRGLTPSQGGGGTPAQRFWAQYAGQGGAGTPGGPPPGGGSGPTFPWYSPQNAAVQQERTLDRIGGDLSRVGERLAQTASDAVTAGSNYRMYTLAVAPKSGKDAYGNTYGSPPGPSFSVASPSSSSPYGFANKNIPQQPPGSPGSPGNPGFQDQGTEGFFNFDKGKGQGTIGGLQNKYLQWYSKTQIAQGIHDYMASTGSAFGKRSVQSTTDIMGIAALAGMDPTQLMPMMTQVTGYTAGSPGGNNARMDQLAGYMQTTFGGNYSQQNVVPYLSAMQNLVPTLYGAGLNINAGNVAGPGLLHQDDYSNQSQLHAASLMKLALNAGYTAADLPDISNMLGNVAQMGETPDVGQQYQFAQIYGEKNLTASPQYFEFQQQQLGYKQQIAQMQLGLNINQGTPGAPKLSVSQLTVNADTASIALNQANLQMGQEQFAQNQASFNFNQWMQTQQLGPIGETPQQTGRAAYFNFMNRQMGAGYNPLNADSASTFQPVGKPFGLQNEEFYAGIENQRSMLTLGRSPLMADAAYQQQLKYLNQQETFYNQQLALQNKDRSFQQTWGQKSLNAQAGVLAAQEKQYVTQQQQLKFDIGQAKIQGQFYAQQLALLQKIATQSLQQIQGQGPVNGQNVTPENLIQSLANQMKMKGGYGTVQAEIQGMRLDAQSQGELMQLVQYLSKGGSLSKIESQMSSSDVGTLMKELQLYEQQGAAAGAKQQAGKSDANLNQGGSGQDWQNLTTAVNNVVTSNNDLAKLLAPTSSLQLYLGTISGYLGNLTQNISGLNGGLQGLIGIFKIFVGGGGGAGGGMGGSGGTGGSMLPLPSMQVHGPYGGARGGSAGVGGEFDMGPSLADNKYTLGWLNLAEDMVAYQQQRKHLAGPSHFGISSPNVNADFGQKLWYGIHQGVDFQASQGTPLLSFNDGIVKNTGFFPWGGEVDIQIPGGMTERYLHLSQIGVTTGQKLKAGDRIGLTGGGTKQSGFGYWSRGPHSHVQVDRGNINAGIDPWPIWALFGDTNLRDFYVGAQAQYSQQQSQKLGSHGYVQNGGGGGTGSSLFHMADGGIAMRPLKAQLMDAGEPEAVIPLSKLRSVMASVASGTPGSPTPASASPASSMSGGARHFTVGAVHVTINTASATMSEQEKDTLMADLISVLDQAAEEKLGTLH